MNCSARDGRPSLSIPPGECPAHALLFLHEGAAAIAGGMDRKGFIRRRGFWLPAGVMATGVVRFGPGRRSASIGGIAHRICASMSIQATATTDGKGRRRMGLSGRTGSGCTTWPATSLNGWKIAGTRTMTELPETVRRGRAVANGDPPCQGITALRTAMSPMSGSAWRGPSVRRKMSGDISGSTTLFQLATGQGIGAS